MQMRTARTRGDGGAQEPRGTSADGTARAEAQMATALHTGGNFRQGPRGRTPPPSRPHTKENGFQPSEVKL